MIFVAILVIVCIADVPLVTAQQSSFCPSALSDLNAYCDARCNRMDVNSRIGPRGPVGKSGPRGSKGSPGKLGPPGVEGLQGPRGEIGVKGSKGEKGNSGPTGPIGEQGPKGEVGNKGYQGAKGESGPKGHQGAKGKSGLRGIKGTVGEKGTNGAKGIVGLRGLIGGPGSKGSKGSVGPKGSIGNPGVMNSTAIKEIVKEIVYSGEVEGMIRKIVYEGLPKSCQEVNITGSKIESGSGGVFDIYSEPLGKKTAVFCDLSADGGGWTVFQRRMDGSENFYRGWADYVNGFGEKDKEFWLGLENIYQMTKNEEYELRIDLEDFSGNTAFAKYRSFRIDSSAQNYKLHVSSYSGNAGDSLAVHNGMEFSTHDADHDASSGNCARMRKGAWWYNRCAHSNLNSLYHDAAGSGGDGVVWDHWKSRWEYLKFTEMKFRRK